MTVAYLPLAWTLDERLQAPTSGSAMTETGLESGLGRWRTSCADDDPDRFRRRLALDGFDEGSLLERLQGQPVTSPAWLETWTAAMAALSPLQAESEMDSTIPFGPVFQPFETFALERLARRSPDGWARLDLSARADLARGLRSRLSQLASQVLFEEFHQRQAEALNTSVKLLMAAMNGTTDVFQAFVHEQDRDRWQARAERYPVLARSLATALDQWIDSHGEWLDRLDRDGPALIRTFDASGLVTALGCNLSDPHRGGRTVLSVTFANGRRVAYKPKDLAIEARYSDMLGWLNDRGILPLDLQGLDVLERDGYGWVRWVEHTPCQDDQAVHRFYRRAGMLLCLVYLLEVTDCHTENLIANGEHPVLIDGETLFMPRVHLGQAADEATARQVERTTRSVLRTSFLPGWAQREKDRAIEAFSGLAAADGQEPPASHQWLAINTDVMAFDEAPAPAGSKSHLPLVEGRPPHLSDYRDAILDGFSSAYRAIRAHRDDFLAPDGPFAACRGVPVRLVLRATMIYGSLLHQQTLPAYLQDGLTWSAGFDRLSLPFTRPEAERRYWPTIAAERQALCELNVPYFEVPSDSTTLPLPDGPLTEAFAQSGWEASRALILAMDEDLLQQQLAIIDESLTRVAEVAP